MPAKRRPGASSARKKKPAARAAGKKATKGATRASGASRAGEKRARAAGPAVQGWLARVREICLALPETKEVEAWGHPTFRVGDKIFASFGADEERGVLGVKTTHELQAALVSSDARFAIAAYVGKHGWVEMTLRPPVDWNEVELLVRGSYRLIAPAKLVRALAAADDS